MNSSTKSNTRVTTFLVYVTVYACLIGYYFTQHNAFLFVYAFINWVGLFCVICAAAIMWKLINSVDRKQLERFEAALIDIKRAIKFSYKSVISGVFTSFNIGLLLYWQAFATVTPLILLVMICLFLRYLVNSFDEHE